MAGMRFGRWVASEVLPLRLKGLIRKRERIQAIHTRAATVKAVPCEHAAARLNDQIEDKIRRQRLTMDYMARTAFSACPNDRIHSGWVALTYAQHLFHPKLVERVSQVETAVQAYRDELTKVS